MQNFKIANTHYNSCVSWASTACTYEIYDMLYTVHMSYTFIIILIKTRADAVLLFFKNMSF